MNKLYNDSHKSIHFALWQNYNPVLFRKKALIEQFKCQYYQELVLTFGNLIGDEKDIEKFALFKLLTEGFSDLDSGHIEHFYKVLCDGSFIIKEKLIENRSDVDSVVSKLEFDFASNTKLRLASFVQDIIKEEQRKASRPPYAREQQGFKKKFSFGCEYLGISTYGYLHTYLKEDGNYHFEYELYELEFCDQHAEKSHNLANFLASLYNAGIEELDLTAPELVVQNKEQYENGAVSVFN